jgi:tRNA(fMet)-specific endonuclease VapC
MDYLLDTNVCIDVIKNRVPLVRKRLAQALQAGAHFYVPSIVAFELWYGASKSAQPDANARLVAAFLAGTSGSLTFDEEDAKSAGRVRAKLEKAGTPIGAYDILIAAQAVRRNITVLTANVREFSRVSDLHWQNWNQP